MLNVSPAAVTLADAVPVVVPVEFDVKLTEQTPLALVVNRDPATGAVLCGDYVENRGHYFGANLSNGDKDALIYFLRFQ